MKKTLYIILYTFALTMLVGYMTWAIWLVPNNMDETECKKVMIEIEDSISRYFISSRDVVVLLRDSGLYPSGYNYSQINTHAIEKAVCANQVVKDAQCYKLTDGTVCIQVQQREPKLRVIGEKNYYIDSERKPMQATFHTASYVPVVTGRVTERMAREELFDFVEWMEDNDFWNAQIEQIVVTSRKEIELVPRVGGHIILLGTLDNYEQKLSKLRQFYTEGFAKMGWKNYKEIDIRYANQVIGRR